MPLLMTYERWISRTYSRVKSRSDSLKLIDEAIKRRDEAGAKKALISWIDEQNKKHQDWHRSVRNGDGAVEELYKQLNVLGSAVPYKNITQEMDDKLAKARAGPQQAPQHHEERRQNGLWCGQQCWKRGIDCLQYWFRSQDHHPDDHGNAGAGNSKRSGRARVRNNN